MVVNKEEILISSKLGSNLLYLFYVCVICVFYQALCSHIELIFSRPDDVWVRQQKFNQLSIPFGAGIMQQRVSFEIHRHIDVKALPHFLNLHNR